MNKNKGVLFCQEHPSFFLPFYGKVTHTLVGSSGSSSLSGTCHLDRAYYNLCRCNELKTLE